MATTGKRRATARRGEPFAASDDEQTILGSADEQTSVAGMMDGDETTVVAIPDEEKESESVVFDSEGNDMDDMELISREQVNESLGAPAMPPVAGGASEDVQTMFAEMSRRMEALEVRCDELVDARDRLERQVAAQTEELRVQRAAIARTQRAVRNLGRGEGDVSEQRPQPTLREPTPSRGRLSGLVRIESRTRLACRARVLRRGRGGRDPRSPSAVRSRRRAPSPSAPGEGSVEARLSPGDLHRAETTRMATPRQHDRLRAADQPEAPGDVGGVWMDEEGQPP